MNPRQFKLALVFAFGLGCYWPLFRKSWIEQLWSNAATTAHAVWAQYYTFIGLVAAFALMAIVLRKAFVHKLAALPKLCLGAAALTMLVNLASGFPAFAFCVSPAFLLTNNIVNALSLVLLTFYWARLCMPIADKSLLIWTFVSLAFGSVIMFAIALPAPANIILPIFAPLISTGAAIWLEKLQSHEPLPFSQRAAQRTTKTPGPDLGLIGTLIIFNLAVAIVYGLMPIDDIFAFNDTWLTIRVTTVLFPAFIAVFIARPRKQNSPITVWIVVTIVLILSFFTLIILAPITTIFGKGFILSGQRCLDTLLWCVLVMYCRRNNASTVVMFALGFVLLETVSSVTANVIIPRFFNAVAGAYEVYFVTATAAVTLVLVIVAIVYLSKKLRIGSDALVILGEGEASAAPAGNAAASLAAAAEFAAAELAEHYKLSQRETEVMMLIARGYSTKRIAESLFISAQTVQTHSKNLYRKLGVHEKQEVIDLVEHTLGA